ncbi:MAG: hypothetical protein WBD75_12520 [Phycisphaerae bacterium]
MKAWTFLVLALVLNAAANILMKVGSKTSVVLTDQATSAQRLFNFLNAATIAGIVLFGANVLFYRKALDGMNISIAYPIMVSVGLILVTLAAAFMPILSERIRAWQIVGMALIAAGVWLVARSSS